MGLRIFRLDLPEKIRITSIGEWFMDYDLESENKGIAKAPLYGAAAFIFLTLCIFTAVTLQEKETLEHWHIATFLLGSGLIAILLFLPHFLEGITEKIEAVTGDQQSSLANKAFFEIKEMRSELDAIAVKIDKVPTLVDKIISESISGEPQDAPSLILDKIENLDSKLLSKLDQIESNSFSSPLLPDSESIQSILDEKIDKLLSKLEKLQKQLDSLKKTTSVASPTTSATEEEKEVRSDPQDISDKPTESTAASMEDLTDPPTEQPNDLTPVKGSTSEEDLAASPLTTQTLSVEEEIPVVGENEADVTTAAIESSNSDAEIFPKNETSEPEDNLADELDLGLPSPEETLRKVDALLASKESSVKPEKILEEQKPSDKNGTTTVIANVMIGIGNKPFLRGEGPGLSWDEGVSMNFVEIGKWAWSPPRKNASLTVQIYRNDQDPDNGGRIEVKPGQKLEITPDFS